MGCHPGPGTVYVPWIGHSVLGRVPHLENEGWNCLMVRCTNSRPLSTDWNAPLSVLESSQDSEWHRPGTSTG